MGLMKTAIARIIPSFGKRRSSHQDRNPCFKNTSIVVLLLFTLTLCLTVLPAIAQAPKPTPLPVQSSAIAPQQLFEQGTALYQSGQFAETASAFQQAAKPIKRTAIA